MRRRDRNPRRVHARSALVPWVLAGAMVVVGAPAAAELSEWAAHVGSFNVTKSPTAAEAGFEARFATRWPEVDAVAGATGTEDGSFWAYGGGRYRFRLDPRWSFTFGLAVALYQESDGKDLGGPVQFRSSYELSYLVGRRSRVALVFYHLSNAGIYALNPGSNSIVLAWTRAARAARRQ